MTPIAACTHTPHTPMHQLYKQVHLHAQTYTYPWLCKYTYISMALYVCTHTHIVLHIYAYACSQISIHALHIHFYPQQIHAHACSSVHVYHLHTRIVGLPQSQMSPTQTLTCSRLCIPLHTPRHSPSVVLSEAEYTPWCEVGKSTLNNVN